MKDNQGDWVHQLQNSLRLRIAELHTFPYYCAQITGKMLRRSHEWSAQAVLVDDPFVSP
jgi:hypothetical protein